ncbi:hypothetical protein Gorai_006419, partial [Gossypium raimondii]|nr:hypothetical protein [Gossypium raimondii]
MSTIQKSEIFIWGPPAGDMIKVNFDATFHRFLKDATVGDLVCNSEGLIMVLCTYPYENVVDPAVAEIRACLQAVTFMEELGFLEIINEGDALTIIKKTKEAPRAMEAEVERNKEAMQGA